ncbi:MAG: hypothetical protein F4X35_03100 [Alphaproteobacteria bacterium]|nr:hypothetical protein [Alphaproteobacteria bacterium]
MSTEAIAIIGAAVGMLAVLVPLLLTLGRRIDAVAADVAEVRRDLGALVERVTNVEATVQTLDARTARIETAVHAHGERIARIEGALTGPWRPPANGPAEPAAAAQPAPAGER